MQEAREYIGAKYGKEYLPDKPRVHRTRAKAAQEAHEAIRPTSLNRDPESLKPHLTAEQHRLYQLIWARMLASQMADARSDATTVNIDAACKVLPTPPTRLAASLISGPPARCSSSPASAPCTWKAGTRGRRGEAQFPAGVGSRQRAELPAVGGCAALYPAAAPLYRSDFD